MEPVNSSQEVFVCETCGYEGFTNAFVYCVKCLNFVIHRYCLKVMPATFDEIVLWYCEHCKSTVGNQITSPKVKSSRSQKEETASLKQLKTTNHKKKQKKKRDIASIIAGTVVVNCQENTTEPEADCILETDSLKEALVKLNSRHERITSSKRGKRKKIAARLDAKKKEQKLQNGLKSETEKACTTMADSIKHSKNGICHTASHLENKLPNQAEKENELQTKQDIVLNVSQSADFENNVPCGQPIIDPVWRGSFSIVDRNYDLFEGFVAHLSTKACDKVYKEAIMLPSLLQLEMHPKTVLWPKSFVECEPSDVNIALYFFPGDQINEKDFEHLVIDMMNENLAMRAMATNAELLIFTSRLLPQFFWRFQGKYYLWGVFKAKKNGSNSVSSHDLTVVKTLDSHSPRSPFSNNGEDGVDMDPESGD